MRGGFVHNEVILRSVEDALRELGATSRREAPVTLPGTYGSIDLLADLAVHRIAVEVELTPDRVPADLLKAEAAGATLLLIVVPTRRVAEAVQRLLERRRDPQPPGGLWVLPLGPAIARLRSCFPFPPPLKAVGKKTTEAAT